MQESRQKESVKGMEEEIKERQSEATSKETLSDLAESEKIADSKRPQSSERASVPSPDGQVGIRRSDGADGSDTCEPM